MSAISGGPWLERVVILRGLIRVLVTVSSAPASVPAGGSADVESALGELRAHGLCAAAGPPSRAAEYAAAWRYSHRGTFGGATVIDRETEKRQSVEGSSAREAVVAAIALIRPETRNREDS